MGVHGGDGGDDVVLHGFYCWFRGVDSVAVGLHNLDGNILGRNEPLDGAGAFIVEDMEGWCVALLFEVGTYTLGCGDHACVFSWFHSTQYNII